MKRLRCGALLLAAVMLMACVLPSVFVHAAETETTTVLGMSGDVTGDGILNTKDLTRLKRYLAAAGDGSVELASTQAADTNGDGKVNNKDLTRLMKYLAGNADLAATVETQVEVTSVFTLAETSNGYGVVAYTGDYVGVTIPSTYGGKPIDTIEAGAFAGKTQLTNVTFADMNCWQAGNTAIPADFLTATAAATYLTDTYANVAWTKTNHTYGEWVVVTSPTATVDGLQTRTCTGCGVTESQVIPATGGSGTDTPSVAPTDFTLSCVLGTADCYTYDGTTLTFTAIDAETTYSIAGTLNGNIVVDVGDTCKFTLEMQGFTLTCDSTNPIMVLTADEFELKAKNGYENYIYDNRAAIDTTDTTLYSAAVYSFKDLEISGKGALTVVSKNNDGIHTKDDLQVKNLALSVTCKDNALKGNDSVEITAANTTLISTMGDCIKTNNSELSSSGKQKGSVTITGGTHNLYAACDGIDAAFDVVIDDATTALNIYTDKYSEYSEEVTAVATGKYYLRYTSNSYKFSVKYSSSSTNEYAWVNVSDTYETKTSSGRTYYYYTFEKLSGYDKMTVYMYNSTQTQGQDSSYYACSSTNTVNTSYDTVSVSYRNGSLSMNWTNYGTTSTAPGGMPGGGMGGGMQEGNTDKGDHSTKGIKAFNEIIINEGTINIQAYDDAIHANDDGVIESGVTPTGNVTVNGGTVTVYSNDDGVHADGTLSVTGGTVNVTNAYEGMEGAYIIISGGSVSVVSLDDGFNGCSTSGAAIQISGGKVYVYAKGDGLDSNSSTSKGAIVFSGGQTVVISNSNGNASIDSDGGYNHTGGTVLALMPTGGMTNETTNGNTTGRTTKSSLSLTSGGYVTVTVGGTTVATVKMPCSMTAYAVYLGSSSATIASATSTTATLDANGVCWN